MAPPDNQPAIVQLVKDSANNFLASLSPDENALFEATKTAESLLQEVESANNEHKDASVSRKAGVALLPFIAGIEQYGQAIDVFANSNDLLCPIWGSIRIVLHVSKDTNATKTCRSCTKYDTLACERVREVLQQHYLHAGRHWRDSQKDSTKSAIVP